MKKSFLLSTLFFLCVASLAQSTYFKGNREFFNGSEQDIISYLDDYATRLSPVEGIWYFSKIEYDAYGNVVSQDQGFASSAIIRDFKSTDREFVEINLVNLLYQPGRIIYNIRQGSGYNTFIIDGNSLSLSGIYEYSPDYDAIIRLGTPMNGVKAVVVGTRVYPKSSFMPPKKTTLPSTPPSAQNAGTIIAKNTCGVCYGTGQMNCPSCGGSGTYYEQVSTPRYNAVTGNYEMEYRNELRACSSRPFTVQPCRGGKVPCKVCHPGKY